MAKLPDKGYTNDAPFLVTHHQDEGEYSRSLHYLLPNGSRRKVTIMSAADNEEIRAKIGHALNSGELRGRDWKRRQKD